MYNDTPEISRRVFYIVGNGTMDMKRNPRHFLLVDNKHFREECVAAYTDPWI